MALPTILFNSSTGSDTAASGAGPDTALSGTGASLNGTTTVTLSADTPDLSGVATDGSAVLWVDTTSGRQYSRITAVDNSADTVTVATTYSVTESGRNWGIGGKRRTLNHADSRTLAADFEAGWIIEFEDDGSLAITGSTITLTGAGPATFQGNSTTTKRLWTQSANAGCVTVSSIGGVALVYFRNFIFENTNGTKTSANGIAGNSTSTIIAINCRFGHATNTLFSGVNRTGVSPTFGLYDCEVMFCTSNGVKGRIGVECVGCYIHDNAASGIATGGSSGVNRIENCVIESNGADGVNVEIVNSNTEISGCTIHGNAGDGIDLSAGLQSPRTAILNNNITGNGGYGIRAASGESLAFLDFNNFGTGALANTSGSMLNLTAGANDLAVDPGYADAANGNFAAGTAIKALGFPLSTRRIGGDPSAGTYGFYDVGIQRAEAGSGGGSLIGGKLVRP